MQSLEAVLMRLEEAGVRLNRDKYFFILPSVKYLGFRISESCLQPTAEKADAIWRAPTLTDVPQPKTFLRLIIYYGKFLPNLSTVLFPLYSLLQKETKWTWNDVQQK